MKPSEICRTVLGTAKINAALDEMTSPQIKAVLKEGGVKVKLPAGFVSQSKRRALFGTRILSAIEEQNDDVAAEFLQQWLLNHRREMLSAYLNELNVRNRQGETDESFLLSRPADKIREAAIKLLDEHERSEAACYLLYIAYQQRSTVFDNWDDLAVRVRLAQAAAGAASAAPATAPST